jgi:hypothetical protein
MQLEAFLLTAAQAAVDSVQVGARAGSWVGGNGLVGWWVGGLVGEALSQRRSATRCPQCALPSRPRRVRCKAH